MSPLRHRVPDDNIIEFPARSPSTKPWTEQRQHDDALEFVTGRPLVSQFTGQMREKAEALQTTLAVVQRTSEWFCRLTEVWPDQCERLTLTIVALRNIVEKLIDLIDDSNAIPMAVMPSRYEVIISSHHIREQAEELIQDLRTLRVKCGTNMRQLSQPRHDIRYELSSLIEEGAELRYHMGALCDRARIHDHTLLAKHTQR